MGFLHIWEVFYHCPQTFYIQVGCETDCAKSSVSSMGHVSMQHCIDKPRAYVCVQELMLITLKSVPKSPLLRVQYNVPCEKLLTKQIYSITIYVLC